MGIMSDVVFMSYLRIPLEMFVVLLVGFYALFRSKKQPNLKLVKSGIAVMFVAIVVNFAYSGLFGWESFTSSNALEFGMDLFDGAVLLWGIYLFYRGCHILPDWFAKIKKMNNQKEQH
jgi:hypothetical protein